MSLAIRNSERRYGIVAMILHWLIALMIIGMMVSGQIMVGMDLSMERFELTQTHKSFGLTVMVLAAARIVWRLMNPVPPLPGGLKAWERVAAFITHYGLYLLLVLMPLTGWLMASASPLGIPTSYFGLFQVPHLLGPNEDAEHVFKIAHDALSKLLLVLFLLHVAAALKHHFVMKDDVLRRMLPMRLKTD